MNKNFYWFLLLSVTLWSSYSRAGAASCGIWQVEYDHVQHLLNVKKNGAQFLQNVYLSYKMNGITKTSKEYKLRDVVKQSFDNVMGKGLCVRYIYTCDTLPKLQHCFYLFEDKDYFLTDFTLEAVENRKLESNRMEIHSDVVYKSSEEMRALFVPYDNDKWIRFKSNRLDFDTLTTYEVSAIYDWVTREGCIIGAVEHDNWKNAIKIKKTDNDGDYHLNYYSGVADTITRDVREHGSLVGKKIKSSLFFVGHFDDWRNGMDLFAQANACKNPPKEWSKAAPFGWNSWGSLQKNINYKKAIEVSDFFAKNLQNNGFVSADSLVVIGLDSFWSNLTEDELKRFVDHCRANGQVAGIYWAPFTDWGKDPKREFKYEPQYKYSDMYAYADGKPQELDGAYALDPTHPAIEKSMKEVSDLFHRCGFQYVKLDFLTHGRMEADSWYRPEILTGTQAYNYGMQLLNKYFGDMYINLSISPIFPSQYAQSRRIACDSWNKIKHTEYTMNALSYGWWIGNLYRFNDADHVVLKDVTEGENRARITSSVITGIYIVGDDFSLEGGNEAKERALSYLTNKDINAIANGRAFHPVEGNGVSSENQFMRREPDGSAYYVAFNYTEKAISISIPFDRMGIKKEDIHSMKNLWNGDLQSTELILIPPKDVCVFKIN
ncbi:MAG: alpha-galactosidase [Proteiniphilum sp.]